MITMKAHIVWGVSERVKVQGSGIELPCKYLVYEPKKFNARVNNELRKRQ